MLELEVIVDYNVILTHFVDTLSCWNRHVEKYVREFVSKEYSLKSADEELLSKFVEIRKPFGWNGESEMFDWAVKGFPDNSKFNELLPIIRFFEQKENQVGEKVSEAFHKAVDLILRYKLNEVATIFENKYSKYIFKLSKLFNSHNVEEQLKCYMLFSPVDRAHVMGGASGDGIYIELTKFDIETKTVNDGDILHEFLHKRVSPHSYYENYVLEISQNKELEATYLGYPDLYTSFIEEAIIYAVCDILRYNKKSPLEKVVYFNEKQRKDMVALWTMVNDIMPNLKAFLFEDASVEITRKELTEYFVQKLGEIPK